MIAEKLEENQKMDFSQRQLIGFRKEEAVHSLRQKEKMAGGQEAVHAEQLMLGRLFVSS